MEIEKKFCDSKIEFLKTVPDIAKEFSLVFERMEWKFQPWWRAAWKVPTPEEIAAKIAFLADLVSFDDMIRDRWASYDSGRICVTVLMGAEVTFHWNVSIFTHE
jgi:hypothetical protein